MATVIKAADVPDDVWKHQWILVGNRTSSGIIVWYSLNGIFGMELYMILWIE